MDEKMKEHAANVRKAFVPINEKVRCLPQLEAGLKEALKPIKEHTTDWAVQSKIQRAAEEKRLRKQQRNLKHR